MTTRALLIALCAAGCNPIPSEIPRDPGITEDESDALDMWLAGAPDNIAQVFFIGRALEDNPNTQCPKQTNLGDVAIQYEGDDCIDPETGASWFGDATRYHDNGLIEYKNFGYTQDDYRLEFHGTVIAGGDSSSSDTAISTELAVYHGFDEHVAWMGVEALLDFNGGDFKLNNISGEVGVEDWGMGQIAAGELFLGVSRDCEFPHSGFLQIEGANQMRWTFGEPEVDFSCTTVSGNSINTVCPLRPNWSIDEELVGRFPLDETTELRYIRPPLDDEECL